MTITHIMLDLETWGKKPGCDIRSIGACVFDPLTGRVEGANGALPPGTTNHGGIAGTFYIATDNPERDTFWSRGMDDEEIYHPHHGNRFKRKYPLTRDPETIAWWNDPERAEAQAAFANPVDLHASLIRFGEWLRIVSGDPAYWVCRNKYPDDIRLWSHGPAFDAPTLAAAYEAVGLPVPWHYRAPRDTRTCFDMAGIDDHSAWLNKHPGPLGIPHHALDDAICQARAVCGATRIVRRWRNTSYADDGLVTQINIISDAIEDEGDRAYFGSTNHADQLREIRKDLEADAFERDMSGDD